MKILGHNTYYIRMGVAEKDAGCVIFGLAPRAINYEKRKRCLQFLLLSSLRGTIAVGDCLWTVCLSGQTFLFCTFPSWTIPN
jgi:hypothetical protein